MVLLAAQRRAVSASILGTIKSHFELKAASFGVADALH